MEIATAAGLPEPQSTASAAASQLNTDLDSFLLLLTAQITNQDPLEPMDSTTFISQLAQLTQVEQTIETNQNLEGIGRQLSSFNELSDVQLIGREVLVASEHLDLNFGEARVQFELLDNADKVSINILDKSGSVIKEIKNLPTSGGEKHTVTWDGLDSNDKLIEDGAYKFEVVSLDSESGRMPYVSYATTFVEELSFTYGQPKLLLRNSDEVSSSVILAVR